MDYGLYDEGLFPVWDISIPVFIIISTAQEPTLPHYYCAPLISYPL